MPETIGEHLRKRRLDLQLLQREVAVIVGVDKATIENWEYGKTTPNLRALPGVIKFLGVDPRPPGKSVGERLRRHREVLGLSWAEAARIMGVDPATVSKWERQDDSRFDHRSVPTVARFLGHNPLPVPDSIASYIRQVRHLASLSQEMFGKCLGVCTNVISRWESEHTEPSVAQLSLTEEFSEAQDAPFQVPLPEILLSGCTNPIMMKRRQQPRSQYPPVLRTLGDHIRKRRLDFGLSQDALALKFGVNRNAVTNWEAGLQAPGLQLMPKVIEFLGYEFLPSGETLATQIREKRRANGLSQAELGKLLGVSRETVNLWERGKRMPTDWLLVEIAKIFLR